MSKGNRKVVKLIDHTGNSFFELLFVLVAIHNPKKLILHPGKGSRAIPYIWSIFLEIRPGFPITLEIRDEVDLEAKKKYSKVLEQDTAVKKKLCKEEKNETEKEQLCLEYKEAEKSFRGFIDAKVGAEAIVEDMIHFRI